MNGFLLFLHLRCSSLIPLMHALLQMAINEAAKDWGLKCLRYEISMLASPPILSSLQKLVVPLHF